MLPLNASDCLIEVATWTGLTIKCLNQLFVSCQHRFLVSCVISLCVCFYDSG
jgi:hypothetical protein